VSDQKVHCENKRFDQKETSKLEVISGNLELFISYKSIAFFIFDKSESLAESLASEV